MEASQQKLAALMEQIQQKGIAWDKVEGAVKTSEAILELYTRSGPVPVTILKGLEKLLGEAE